MRTHDVKTWPEPFAALWEKSKRHEVRKDDRGYAVGDELKQWEYLPDARRCTDRWILHRITYKTPGGSWGLPVDICVLSIEEIERSTSGDKSLRRGANG